MLVRATAYGVADITDHIGRYRNGERIARCAAGFAIPIRRDWPDLPRSTALRAMAALMVLTTHVAFHTGQVTATLPRSDPQPTGSRGLPVLPALRIPAVPAVGEGRDDRHVRARASRRYARKRVARIYPAYFVLVVVVLGLYPPVAVAPREQWAAYLTLTQVYFCTGWRSANSTRCGAWPPRRPSTSLLPVLAWFAGRRHPWRSRTGALAGSGPSWRPWSWSRSSSTMIRAWTTWLARLAVLVLAAGIPRLVRCGDGPGDRARSAGPG